MTSPTEPGSGGGSKSYAWPPNLFGAGGGVVRLIVSGMLVCNGRISANGMPGASNSGGGGSGGSGGGAGLSQFDKMLANAGITPEVFDRLSQGLKKLTETTNNFNAMGDLAATTNEYAGTIRKANESLLNLSDSVRQTAKSMTDTSTVYHTLGEATRTIESGGKSYQEKLENLNKNLSALNAAYELQLRGANDHVKSSDVIYKGIEAMMKDLSGSADDTKKYREQVSKLNDNLTSLNNVYGNMLAAMNVK
jgi:gliding motility-associated protein GldL